MVVLITGITGGLGGILAPYLIEKGMTVYGTSRNPSTKMEGVKMLPMNITDIPSVQNCLTTVAKQEGRIDAVINCINKLVIGSVEETTVEEFRKSYETNVIGAYTLNQQILPIFRKQDKGLIINMSSAGGILSIPYFGSYTSSKAALESMSESLYHELRGTNIDVVVMQPIAMHIDRPATGKHIELSAQVKPNSKSHKMVKKMKVDTLNSKITPLMVSKKIYEVLIYKGKRPFRVRMGMSKGFSFLKRIAPQSVLDFVLKKALPTGVIE